MFLSLYGLSVFVYNNTKLIIHYLLIIFLFRFPSQCVLLAHVSSENTKWCWNGSISHFSQGTCTRLTSLNCTECYFIEKVKHDCLIIICVHIICVKNKAYLLLGKISSMCSVFHCYKWLTYCAPTSIPDRLCVSRHYPAGASCSRAELFPGGNEAGGSGSEKSTLYLPGNSWCAAWSGGAGHLWWMARGLWLLLPLWLAGHLPSWLVYPHWRQPSAARHQRSEP